MVNALGRCTFCGSTPEERAIDQGCGDCMFHEAGRPSRLVELAEMRAPVLTPEEILRRIKLARYPAIATDDAYTVAKLHDLVIEFVRAEREATASRVHPWIAQKNEPARERMREADVRLERARAALEVVAGVESCLRDLTGA